MSTPTNDAAKRILGRSATPDITSLRKERRRLDGRPMALNSNAIPSYTNARSWSQVGGGPASGGGGGYPTGYVTPCNLPTLVLEGPPEDLGDNGQTKLKILLGGTTTPQAKRKNSLGSNPSSPGSTPSSVSATTPQQYGRKASTSTSPGPAGAGQLSQLSNTSGAFTRNNSSGAIKGGGSNNSSSNNNSNNNNNGGGGGAQSVSIEDSGSILASESSVGSVGSGGGGSGGSLDGTTDETLHQQLRQQTSNLSAGSLSRRSGSSGSMSTPGGPNQLASLRSAPNVSEAELDYQGPVQHEVKNKYNVPDSVPEGKTTAEVRKDNESEPGDFPLMDLPPHFPRGGLQRLGKWTTNLCDFGGECCESLVCGPIAGSNQHLLLTYGYQEVPENLPGYSPCLDRYCEIGFGFLIDWLFLCAWTRYRAVTVRNKVALHFNLQRDGACCIGCMWPCCSLAQTNRELLTRRCPPKSFCCAPTPIVIDRSGVAKSQKKKDQNEGSNPATFGADSGSTGSLRKRSSSASPPAKSVANTAAANSLFIKTKTPPGSIQSTPLQSSITATPPRGTAKLSSPTTSPVTKFTPATGTVAKVLLLHTPPEAEVDASTLGRKTSSNSLSSLGNSNNNSQTFGRQPPGTVSQTVAGMLAIGQQQGSGTYGCANSIVSNGSGGGASGGSGVQPNRRISRRVAPTATVNTTLDNSGSKSHPSRPMR